MSRRITLSYFISIALTSSACSFIYDFKKDDGRSSEADAGGKAGQSNATTGKGGDAASQAGTTSSLGGAATQGGAAVGVGGVAQAGTVGSLGGASSQGGATTPGGTSGTSGGTSATGGAMPTAGTTGKATAVCIGNAHSCALVSGSVYCWGDGRNGQLGQGRAESSSSPVKVAGDLASARVDAISCGYEHTCALANQKVYCWGYNAEGELGSSNSISTTSNVPVVVKIDSTNPLTGVTNISVGDNHSCAVAGGAVYCWGYNSYRQLGDPNVTSSSSVTPVLAKGLESGATAVSAGSMHSCAIVGGSVYCWGYNNWGTIGTGTATGDAHVSSPTLVVSPLSNGVSLMAAGYEHHCAVQTNKLYCWGCNYRHELGDQGDNGDSAKPIEAYVTASIGSITSLALGVYMSCAIAVGKLYCWGDTTQGQLGYVSTDPGYSDAAYEISFGAGAQVTAAAVRARVCAVVDGDVWCWGAVTSGEVTKTRVVLQ